jgi:hypothetical protein
MLNYQRVTVIAYKINDADPNCYWQFLVSHLLVSINGSPIAGWCMDHGNPEMDDD